MYLTKNRLGVVVIIVAIISSVCGGFFLNGEEQTTCESDFQYVTDVSAVFTGTDSDMKVEYNPQSNVTGYSVTRPGDTSSTKVLGIEYTAASANGYWVQETTGDAVVRNLSIAPNPYYSSQISQYADITIDNDPDKDPSTRRASVEFPFIPNVKAKYPSLYVGSLEYTHVMGLSMEDLLGWYDGFQNTTGSISIPDSLGFPGFIAGVSSDVEVKTTSVLGMEISRTEITHIYYKSISSSIELDAASHSATVGGNKVQWDDAFIVWVPEEGLSDIPLIIGGMTTTSYIDPAEGVRPTPTKVESVISTSTVYYSDSLSGGLISNISPLRDFCGGTLDISIYGVGLESKDPVISLSLTSVHGMGNQPAYVETHFKWKVYGNEGEAEAYDYGPYGGYLLTWSVKLRDDGSIELHGWPGSNENPFLPSPDIINKVFEPGAEKCTAFSYMESKTSNVKLGDWPTSSMSDCRAVANDLTNGTSSVLEGIGFKVYNTSRTETHTEKVEKTYTKTYWKNGYSNSDISILLASENGSHKTQIWAYTPSEKYAVSVFNTNGSWSAGIGEEPIELGSWKAMIIRLSVANDILEFTAYPCAQFENFRSYTVIDKPVVLGSVPSYGKSIGYLMFDTASFGANIPASLLGIVSTTILLEGGGLYTQNGVFSMEKSFPNDKMVRFRVMASAHVGDSMTVKASGGEAATFPATEDGWLIDGSVYPFDKLSIYYVSPDFESVGIGGIVYPGGIYVGADFYEKGHVYYSVGNGPLVDIGESDDGWTITLDGTWAVSTAYYEGENTASSVLVMGDPSVWGWSKEEFLTVFIGVTIVGMIICAWRFETGIMDWAVPIGAVIICFSLMG